MEVNAYVNWGTVKQTLQLHLDIGVDETNLHLTAEQLDATISAMESKDPEQCDERTKKMTAVGKKELEPKDI